MHIQGLYFAPQNLAGNFPSVLGGHVTKCNDSSTERRHFPSLGVGISFQDAHVIYIYIFKKFCDTRRVPEGYSMGIKFKLH
jgi:hypothetical protein